MLVTGVDEWYIAYLIGNSEFEVTLIERDEELCDLIKDECIDFWKNHVEKGVAPSPSGEGVDFAALQVLYPVGEDNINLPDLEKTYDALKDANEKKKALEKEINEHKQNIQAAMGDYEVAYLGETKDGKPKKATWKRGKDKFVEAHTRKGSRVFRTA